MPLSKVSADLSLEAADHAAMTMVEDHLKNNHRHEMRLLAMSPKAERLLWHQ